MLGARLLLRAVCWQPRVCNPSSSLRWMSSPSASNTPLGVFGAKGSGVQTLTGLLSGTESGVELVVINPASEESTSQGLSLLEDKQAQHGAKVGVVYNLQGSAMRGSSAAIAELHRSLASLNPSGTRALVLDLLHDPASAARVSTFVESVANDGRTDTSDVSLLPQMLYEDIISIRNEEDNHASIFLNIPLENESGSLKRQGMVLKEALRSYIGSFSFRMNSTRGRHESPHLRSFEKKRFDKALEGQLATGNLRCLVTDTQALDLVDSWTTDDQGNEMVPVTTFALAMTQHLSNGYLEELAYGISHIQSIKNNLRERSIDHPIRVLVSQPCNANSEGGCACERDPFCGFNTSCEDHASRIIPEGLADYFDHPTETFRSDQLELTDPSLFDVVVLCGGCHIAPQAMETQIKAIVDADVSVTNTTLLLSFLTHKKSFVRTLKPWGMDQIVNPTLEVSAGEEVSDKWKNLA